MFYSKDFADDANYRLLEFQTAPEDRPLVIQFCGNDAATLLRAAKLVENQCDAIDINLGCPQRIAHSGHFGAYLLGPEDRFLILNIVSTLANNLSIPVLAKIRLLDTFQETLTLCTQLEAAGCAGVAVHARARGTPDRRREGPADLTQISRLKASSSGLTIPIISNGNIRCFEDIAANFHLTNADAMMSAEGLLDNPSLFCPPSKQPDSFALSLEYLQLTQVHPGTPFEWIVRHAQRICKKELRATGLYEACGEQQDTLTLKELLLRCQKLMKSGKQAAPATPTACTDGGQKKKNKRELRKEEYRRLKIERRARERKERNENKPSH
eukprot:gb/GEZN01011220.1/.p1 GENE.gb/GEZN01011220.1/~~gb/GEZN01011220.1/.p1  ORF type:complete len:365 (-),score=39.44 gb/GEZN01011220.1/:84-1061(-)